MTNLNDYKNLKKIKLVYNDLIAAREQLTNSIESLKKFAKYNMIGESLSVLHTSRTLIEIHINKFKRTLEKSE